MKREPHGLVLILTALPLVVFEQTPLFHDLIQFAAIAAAIVFAVLALGVIAYNLTH